MKINRSKYVDNSTPYAIVVAAKATELDNIKIVPIDDPCKTAHKLVALKIFNFKNRLIRRAVKRLNNDIREALERNPDSVLYVYALAYHEFHDFTVHLHMEYEIK